MKNHYGTPTVKEDTNVRVHARANEYLIQTKFWYKRKVDTNIKSIQAIIHSSKNSCKWKLDRMKMKFIQRKLDSNEKLLQTKSWYKQKLDKNKKLMPPKSWCKRKTCHKRNFNISSWNVGYFWYLVNIFIIILKEKGLLFWDPGIYCELDFLLVSFNVEHSTTF